MGFLEGDYVFPSRWKEFEDSINSGAKYIHCSEWVDSKNIMRMLAMALESKVIGLSIHQESGAYHGCIRHICLDIVAALQDYHHLKELSLTGIKKLNRAEVEALGLLVKNNSSLVALTLNSSLVAFRGGWTEALRINTTLRYMDLSESWGSKDFVIDLAQGLKINAGLEELRLGYCSLDDTAAVALADALETNTTLLTLCLNGNRINGAGGAALAQSLLHNASLLILDLNDNHGLGDEAGLAFAQVLGEGGNRTLRKLCLEDNQFYQLALSSLAEVVNVNEVIEVLRIRPKDPTISLFFIPSVIEMDKILAKRREKRKKLRFEAFEKAIGSEVTTPWQGSRLMVVGRGAAGKSNIVRTLLGLPFNPQWDSTVGIELKEVATASGAKWKAQHKDFVTNFLYQLPVVNQKNSKKGSKSRKLNGTHTSKKLKNILSVVARR